MLGKWYHHRDVFFGQVDLAYDTGGVLKRCNHWENANEVVSILFLIYCFLSCVFVALASNIHNDKNYI